MGRATDVLTQIICDLRGQHRWSPFGVLSTARDPNMRYAEHDYCTRCESHRLRWKAGPDGPLTGEETVVSRTAVVALFPEWLEALYRARWGEYPRRRVTIGGGFPPEWGW